MCNDIEFSCIPFSLSINDRPITDFNRKPVVLKHGYIHLHPYLHIMFFYRFNEECNMFVLEIVDIKGS